MKKLLMYGTAVLALSATPLLAQTGGGTPGQTGGTSGPTGATQPPPTRGATDQGGSRPGSGIRDDSPGDPQPGLPIGSKPGRADSPARGETADSGESADRDFVIDAATGGMAEIELGKLATEKTTNDRVKQFAQRMVLDHGKTRDELTSLAQSRNISMPTELDAKHKTTHDRLAKLSGDAFDQAYLEAMVAGHQQAVADFRAESQIGKDEGLRAWAAKTLPVLEGHFKMAQDLNQSIGRAVGTSGRPVK